MSNFTREQKARCVLWLAELGDVDKVQKNFKHEFEVNHVPEEEEIKFWYECFKNTGTFEQKRMSVDLRTTTYEKETGLLNFFGFKKLHRCHPYKMRLNAALEEEDLMKRKEFAEHEIHRIHLFHDLHLKSLWFCGEATFYTNGRVECHNLTYLSEDPQNPETNKPFPQNGAHVTVFAALNSDSLLWPHMITGPVDHTSYQLFLRKFCYELDQIQRCQSKNQNAIFVHDENPIHVSFSGFLNDQFPNKWIGPESTYEEWPRNSPDINPLTFFLWGHIKSKVYEKSMNENDTTELGNRIYHAFMEVTPEMMDHAVKAYKERLKIVVESGGGLVDPHNEDENNLTANDEEVMNWMMYSF